MRRGRQVGSAVALTALLLATLAGPARADVYDDNPAAASLGPGDVHLFARAADGETLERHSANGSWTDWTSLGGDATSGPAAVAYGGNIDVFVRGTDGAIYQDTLTAGTWSGWISLGGAAASAPSATVRRGVNYLDLAYKGTDNALWLSSYVPAKGWSPWTSVGGNVTSAPALNSQSAGILNLFTRATDGTLAELAWNGTAWNPWSNLGGGIVGAPAAVTAAAGTLDMYVVGTNDALYRRHWAGGAGWTPFAQLDPTAIDSTPAAVSDDGARELLFARSGPNLVTRTIDASGNGAWSSLGPVALPAPAPGTPAPTPTPVAPAPSEVSIQAGLRCTPPGGQLRVDIQIHKPAGKAKARVQRIVFYTKGKGRRIKVDRRRPFVVRLTINAAAGKTSRVYARVYYRRSAHGKLLSKTVSKRYVVCR